MFLRKGLLFFALFGLLICTGETTAGPNANAVLSLDLIADGGVGNERDDGVTSGTVSGQGTKIAVEVFATGVTTSLVGVRVEFDFDASVLTYVGARNSASLITLQNEATGTVLGALASSPATLSESGFLARAEFTTAVDVTDREFSIGIKSVILVDSQTSSDEITTTEVITFNAAPSPDFNDDGIVDLLDYGLFRNQWNTRAGGPNWDAKFDLNGDGIIDLGDYAIFRDNWNKTFPVSPSDGGDDEEIVSIPDMNLRAVVEDSLGKASGETITRAEMATLTRFAAVNANISDVTGLEFATNLTALFLQNNTILDLSPLSGLTNLTALALIDNPISDLTLLSNLTNLTRLFLINNSIVDISPLSNLTNLTRLFLDNNSIMDISPLSNLTNLTRLFLDNNSIMDISPLSNLTNLEWLHLRSNSITDLSPLVANTGWGSGDRVDVRNNPLSPTSINTHIPDLQSRGVAISFDPTPYDPTPVSIPDANLRAAIETSLNKASGETITRGDMSILIRIDLNSQDISDLTGLEFATRLTDLSLQSNSISDLSPLSGLTNLTNLRLSRNSITDLSPLSGLTNLERLWLFNNLITDLSPLSGLTNLITLNLGNNTITDVSALSGLTSLRSLYLFSNSIVDVSALSGLTSLTNLRLSSNSITDVSALSGLTNLETLWLRSNSITDLAPLVANTGLGSGDDVDVRNNPLSDASINTHIPALQNRGVTVQF